MYDLTQIEIATIPVHDLVLFTFYLVLAGYTIFTAIFYYHWKAYGSDTRVTNYTLISYFLLTLPLVLVMGILTLKI
ncbi:hypothetical protein KC902_00375 [Candidatus Kaiserbacteria bacterium]|nr:hypothetical protein [Candidatus Kaiserbacteria bacterium]USN88885.1 MAG: hypothetical protein H6780_00470 [Candidatus Nomurabacteria bacterium]